MDKSSNLNSINIYDPSKDFSNALNHWKRLVNNPRPNGDQEIYEKPIFKEKGQRPKSYDYNMLRTRKNPRMQMRSSIPKPKNYTNEIVNDLSQDQNVRENTERNLYRPNNNYKELQNEQSANFQYIQKNFKGEISRKININRYIYAKKNLKNENFDSEDNRKSKHDNKFNEMKQRKRIISFGTLEKQEEISFSKNENNFEKNKNQMNMTGGLSKTRDNTNKRVFVSQSNYRFRRKSVQHHKTEHKRIFTANESFSQSKNNQTKFFNTADNFFTAKNNDVKKINSVSNYANNIDSCYKTEVSAFKTTENNFFTKKIKKDATITSNFLF